MPDTPTHEAAFSRRVRGRGLDRGALPEHDHSHIANVYEAMPTDWLAQDAMSMCAARA